MADDKLRALGTAFLSAEGRRLHARSRKLSRSRPSDDPELVELRRLLIEDQDKGVRRIAREQNQRDQLGPITGPGVLRMVARFVAEWQERQKAEGKEADR
jgi:hypothetical protein